jgi:hypothetical protein
MPSISGTATFEVQDLLQPSLLGTGLFSLTNNRLTDFQFQVDGLTFDESDMSGCQCSVDYLGFFHVVLEGDHGFFVWDFQQGIFSIGFEAPGVAIHGTSEDNVSGILTSNTLHAVGEPATAGMFLLAALAVVVFGRRFETPEARRALKGRRTLEERA